MATLYPPYIEGKLPAQVGDTLRIPYQLNRAVGELDLQGATIRAQIKTVSTNSLVTDQLTSEFLSNSSNGVYTAIFTEISSDLFTVGQFYKIQLCFEKEGYAGQYYSTVGVFKYTTMPEISIDGLESNTINGTRNVLTGRYNQEKDGDDKNEKVESYKFDIYQDNTLIETSDWQIHNASTDTTVGQSFDTYALKQELNKNIYYLIRYSVRTMNCLEVSSPTYMCYNGISIPFNLEITSFAKMNYDEGYMAIGFTPTAQVTLKGYYALSRSCDGKTETVKEFLFDSDFIKDKSYIIFKDFTVEQGKEYQYYLSQYSIVDDNNRIYSNKISMGETVLADFEDMFLWDGARQLKIRFNPKMTSFKTTLLESKLDTIGGQYPFFFRNGRTAYHEFPISGLISFLMDENRLFMDLDKGEVSYRTSTSATANTKVSVKRTDLISENITKEREFKLAVLNWLNNGKPKLLRTPTEGNYLVRLMNISLAPEDRLGRMLHTFSGQAYEIGEATYKSLIEHNMINTYEEQINTLHNHTVSLTNEIITLPSAVLGRIYDAAEGTVITIAFADGIENTIVIGRTGVYNIITDENNPLVKVKGQKENIGKLEYWYKKENSYPLPNVNITDVVSYTEKVDQIYGPIERSFESKPIKFLRIQSKDIDTSKTTVPTGTDGLLSTSLYKISENEYYSVENLNKPLEEKDLEYTYKINGEEITLHSGRIEIDYTDIANITTIQLGNALYADVYYGETTITPEKEGE